MSHALATRFRPARLRRMRLALAACLITAAVVAGAVAAEDETHGPGWSPPPAALPVWDVAALKQKPTVQPAEEAPAEGVRAIWFDTLPFNGRPTKAFAYLGLPERTAGTVPGVVLVHGGGGTAFSDWVKTWTARGYAAIACDLEGQIPIKNDQGGWRRIDSLGKAWGGGPSRAVAPFGDAVDKPFGDQWPYHAVADTLLAASVLGSMPEVDASRIGLVGISWGSVIATIAGGVDDRPCFVVSQYIGGFLDQGTEWYPFMRSHPQTWAWDPAWFYGRGPSAKRWLWINGANDRYGTPPMQAASFRATSPRSWMTMSPSLGHGHIWDPRLVGEIYAFADATARGAQPLPRVVHTRWRDDAVDIRWEGGPPVRTARWVFSREPLPDMGWAFASRPAWWKVEWQQQEISVDSETVDDGLASITTLARPRGMVAGWVNLIDDRGLCVSSEPLVPTP